MGRRRGWRHGFRFCFILTLMLQLFHVHAPPPNESQRQILDLLAAAWQGADLAGWGGALDCSDWEGLQCDEEGNVLQLDLYGDSLIGPIPPILGSLEHLEVLRLESASLTGEIPKEITQLNNLRKLTLSGNDLYGSIPDGLGRNQSLVLIDLSFNILSGSIPDSLGDALELEFLYLNNNNLNGSIPASLGGLLQLADARLSSNYLIGSIPANIGNLIKLTILNLRENRLEGEIPESIGSCTALTQLILDKNMLSGRIPNSIGSLTRLVDLQLSFNNFSGPFPPTIGLLQSLTQLDLQSNFFSAEIPSEIEQLTSLEQLSLSANCFSGSIPQSITNLTKLQSLIARENHLSGTLPKKMFQMTALTTLDLHRNFIEGELPSDISPNIEYIDLGRNNFSGTIPKEWFSLSQITQIKASMNRLVGTLPSEINNPTLLKLDFSWNNLTGNFPRNITPSLISIDFGRNNLSGPLIFNSTTEKKLNLQTLLLSWNQFNGTVPDILSVAPDLACTTLRYNQFSGEVPPSLVNTSSDITVQLAGNPLCNSTENLLDRPTQIACIFMNLSKGFVAKPFCANGLCAENESPNFSIWTQNGGCMCSTPLTVVMSMESPLFSVFNKAIKVRLEAGLAALLQLTASQVYIPSVKRRIDWLWLVTVRVFPNGTEPWSVSQEKYMVEILENNGTSLGEYFGPLTLLSSSLDQNLTLEDSFNPPSPLTPSTVPPPMPPIVPLPPPSSTSPLGRSPTEPKFGLWCVVLIVALFALFLGVLGCFICICVKKERGKPKASSPPPPSPPGLEALLQARFAQALPLSAVAAATGGWSPARRLGEGAYGVVYGGASPAGLRWAVKRAKPRPNPHPPPHPDPEPAAATAQTLLRFRNEVEVISKMNHRNLVRLLGYCCEGGEQVLVYEFMPNGTVYDRLHRRGGRPLSFAERLQVAVGAAQGLHYLHKFAKPAIVHRDIKSENILLDADMQAKVADFGLLKHLASGDSATPMSTRVAGTPGYLDPEYHKTFKVTAKSDVYSFGVVLLELITGRTPIFSNSINESEDVTLVNWANSFLTRGKLELIVDPSLGGAYPPEALRAMAAVAAMCTQTTSRLRPDMAEVAWRLVEIQKAAEESFKNESRELGRTEVTGGGSFTSSGSSGHPLSHGGSSSKSSENASLYSNTRAYLGHRVVEIQNSAECILEGEG